MNFFSSAPPEASVISFYLWVRVFLWCAVIILFSSIPNYDEIPLDFESAFGIIRFLSRKIAHLLEYGYLMIFFFRALEKSAPQKNKYHFLSSLGFVILFSIFDEFHQSFVYGRDGSRFDIFVDTVGAAAAFFLFCEKSKKETLS